MKPTHSRTAENETLPPRVSTAREPKLDSLTRAQHERLRQLRDAIIDSITDGAKVNLRARSGLGAESSRDDPADAGNEASDCDLALSLLAQERDALVEIEDALQRIEAGVYGVCEICGKSIPRDRLEAIPFARYEVGCQSSLEKQRSLNRARQSVAATLQFEEEAAASKAENELEIAHAAG